MEMIENFEKIKKKTRTKYNTNINIDTIRIKPGMCFFDDAVTNKHRLAVVLKTIDNIVIFTTLTSTLNDHAFKAVNSDGFIGRYFSYVLNRTYIAYVKARLISGKIDKQRINFIIKELKDYYCTNL
jgi:hypothetical protein